MTRSTRLLGGLGAILVSSNIASAALVEHFWNISYTMANPDGLFERRVIGVNGSWPPPPIVVNQFDTLRVHAFNGLGGPLGPEMATALHSHGNFFNGSNYYDGAVGVTQCPIPAGQELTYEIPVNLQHGTYWIHGHYKGQYVDGLRAPLIIHPNVSRTDITWDDEFTVILGDWYHRQHDDMLVNQFMTWSNPSGAEPVPESAVIYLMHNNTYINTQSELSSGQGVSDNAILPFQAGKKYRIRVINMSALAMFHLTMQNHTMQIIELDGIEVSPYEVDVLPVAVAQRYSIYVEAKNETNTDYAFMVMQDTDMYDAVPEALVLNNTIQIQYSDANAKADPIEVEEWGSFNDVDTVPVQVEAQAPADVDYTFNVWFDTFNDGTNRAAFNNITYLQPIVPTIFTALTMGNDSSLPQVYGAQTHGIVLEHMQNVQMTVINWDAGNHPFHLHGHVFQVVSRSYDVGSDDETINPPVTEGLANPARRDTIMIPSGGSVTLRFRADNPGVWFFHCHIDWHLSSGLALAFIESPDYMQKNLTMPKAMLDQCAAQNIPTSGNAVGLMSTTDLKGQPLGPYALKMGWTPKAIGALAGCIITALLGFLTVVWYSWGDIDEEDLENEVKRKQELKAAKGGKFGFLKGKRVRADVQ